MAEEAPKPKIGAGHLEAFARQGLNELRNAIFADSNVAQRHPEPGLYGTAIPSEVGEQRKKDLQPEQPRESNGMEMDR